MILQGTVLDQIAKVVERRALLLRHGLDALFGAQEGDHEQDQTQGGPYGHGHLPAVRAIVAFGELGYQRQREAADDELGDIDGDEAEGSELGALIQVAGHDAAQGGVRHVVHRVERHHHRVCDCGVCDQGAHVPTPGRGVGENHYDCPGYRRPQDPRTEPAPARVGAVGEDAHDRVEHRVPQPGPKQNGGGGAGGQAEGVGVKVRLEENHRHEDEIRGRVGGAVARHFKEREFLGLV